MLSRSLLLMVMLSGSLLAQPMTQPDGREDRRQPALDIAPFAQVFTGDPRRTDGSRASRIQEYRADDVFLEEPLLPDTAGRYPVPTVADGAGCIGLKWLEGRRIQQLALEFADSSEQPAVDGVHVQCWVGETAWQGGWKTLRAEFEKEPDRWLIWPDWSSVPETKNETRKIRFLFPPSSRKTVLRKLYAYTPTPTEEKKFLIQLAQPAPGRQARVECYNGQIVSTNAQGSAYVCEWNPTDSLRLTVRYTRPKHWKSDRTVLRFQFPKTAFGVAIDDVLAAGCVYIREAGLLVSTDPPATTFEDYLKQTKSRETILQQVRRLPDQTLAQAMKVVHRPQMETGPTMLSLAGDNHKCVVLRNGVMRFSGSPETDEQEVSTTLSLSCHLEPSLGSAASNQLTRHLDGGWLPIVVNTYQEGGLIYRQTTFVAPLGPEASAASSKFAPQPSVCVAEFHVENTGDAPAPAKIALTFLAEAKKKRESADLLAESSGVAAFVKDRLFAWLDRASSAPLRIELDGGTANAVGTLNPRSSVRLVAYVPLYRVARSERPHWPDGNELLDRTRRYWRQMLSDCTQIELPDELLTNVIRASQVHCLLAARNEENGQRVAPWIASMGYGPLESEGHSIIRGLDYMGHHEFARRALDFYIHRYNPEGFLTTGYTLMGTGWHLWSLGEHYALAQDTEWLKSVAPEVTRVCAWIVRQRQKTMRMDAAGQKPPEFGLMPPGVMADWNAFAYYFCLNGFYCAGLRDAAHALVAVGHPGAEAFLKEADQFREDILRAYLWTQARMPVYPLRDGSWIPGYPSQVHGMGPTNNFFPGQDHNRSWCYDVELGANHLVPFGILDPMSPDAAGMMDHLEDVQFLQSGWYDYPAEASQKDPYNLGGFSKVQPYYCRNAEIYALRDDVKPFIRSYFNTIPSLLNTENLSIWEHFHAEGGWNKTHETGYFLHQTRTMLATERGRELWLAPLVTNNWLKNGMTIAVRNVPTRFGPMSYRIVSATDKGYIEATIEPPTRSRPEAMVIRLRHPEGRPIKAVTVNDQPHQAFDPQAETVRIMGLKDIIKLRASY